METTRLLVDCLPAEDEALGAALDSAERLLSNLSERIGNVELEKSVVARPEVQRVQRELRGRHQRQRGGD